MEIQISTRAALVLCFYNKQIFHKNSYSWMSLIFILKQLREFYNIGITISGLKWQLNELKRSGLMKFYKNNCGRRSDGTIYRRPSNRMFTVKGLLWLKAHGLKIAGWLWDHVTKQIKLPRGKGQSDYDKKQLAAREAVGAPNGVRKLISSIGKSVRDLKLFTL